MIHGFRFTALGCTGRMRLAGCSLVLAQAAVAAAVRWLRGVEARLSRYRDDSLVARLNAGEPVPPDADLVALLAAAGRGHHLTAGRYDATALPVWRLWHDPARTRWPDAHDIMAARVLVDWPAVMIGPAGVHLARPGMALDLGGVGKEWCVDRLIEQLIAHGCADVLVELGGDCAARGCQPGRDGWFVLLPGAAAALTLRDEGIATSGIGSRRRELAGRVVSHLIDARSGFPAAGIVRSATVLAPDCLDAGIHASDLCLLADAHAGTIAERSGGRPSWVRASDGTLFADPRLLERLHPVANAALPGVIRMKRSPWLLVVVFALIVWLVPLLIVWAQAGPVRRPLVRAPLPDGAPPSKGPLILYADTWPTRAVINLKEIQAATAETDHALGPKAVANDVALALEELGVTSEPMRLDDLPAEADLLTGRPIVLVYPVRHGCPPAAIMQFVDRRLEPLVGGQDPALPRLRILDVAIAEKSDQAESAQKFLDGTMRYYGVTYRPGVALLEPMNSIVIYEHLRAFAKQVPE